MKVSKILLVTAMIAVCLPAMASFGADVAKIGVVDFQRVFENSTAGKEVKAELNKKGSEMEADLKAKGTEIEALKDRLERESLVMDKEKREESEREFRIQVNDIKALKKKYEANLKEVQQRLVNRIKKEVFDIVQEIGKSEGYLLIIENIGVLYAPNTLDLTDEIIEKYNARYTKGAATQ